MKSQAGMLVVVLAFAPAATQAATLVVNGFGVNGWKSWDTRDTSGARLGGLTLSHPGLLTGTNTGTPVTYSTASDVQIAKQIVFMGEGNLVPDAASLSGTATTGPSGSLNGLGYVRLDGTTASSGKSDFSFRDSDGFAAATALADPGFTTQYRYYPALNPSSQKLNLNFDILGTNGNVYTLSHTALTVADDTWNEESVNGSTSLFLLYLPDGSNTGSMLSLADLAGDASWSPILFGAGAEITRVGLNLGRAQKNNLTYVDWVETSVLNGGERIDFQAVPEPGTLTLLLAAAAVGAVWRRRRR